MSFKSEEEIRPKNVFQVLLDCCREDAFVLSKTAKFEDIDCPACGSAEKKAVFNKHGFSYVECLKCNSLFNSPRPDEASFAKFYPQSKSSKFFFESFYPAVETARKEKLIPERVQRVLSFINKSKDEKVSILDVGAGQAFFFDIMRNLHPEFDYRVIEPNPSLAQACIEKGYSTIIDFLENIEEWKNEIDFITCFEVFEHTLNPDSFLLQFKKLLKPGGKLLITSLTRDGLDINYLLDKADIVAPPQHLNFLSVEGYRKIFEKIGFTKTEIITPGKLDVNIVMNKIQEYPDLADDHLFNFIKRLDNSGRGQFQQLLADNLMSSHIWVIATL